MKIGLVALVGALLLCSAVASADVFITDYYGFSWETTPGGPYVPWQPGNLYQMVGVVDAILPPLTYNPALNEYTFVMDGHYQRGAATVVGSGFDLRGAYTVYQILYYDGGTMNIYEDPSKNSLFTPNPTDPLNLDVPEKFVDGTLYLSSTCYGLYAIINRYTVSGDEIGSFETLLEFTGGSHVGEIGGPGSHGYSFAGLTKNPHASIPVGYKERIDGQQFVTPVEPTTWGGVKNLYR